MNKPFFHTISEIRRLYIAQKLSDELSGEWSAVLFYRWISFFCQRIVFSFWHIS